MVIGLLTHLLSRMPFREEGASAGRSPVIRLAAAQFEMVHHPARDESGASRHRLECPPDDTERIPPDQEAADTKRRHGHEGGDDNPLTRRRDASEHPGGEQHQK